MPPVTTSESRTRTASRLTCQATSALWAWKDGMQVTLLTQKGCSARGSLKVPIIWGSSTFWRTCEEPQGPRACAWNERTPGHRFKVSGLARLQCRLPPPPYRAPSWEVLCPPGASQNPELIMPSSVLPNEPSGAKGRVVLLESYPNHHNQDMNAMARHFQICWMSEVFFESQLIVQVLQESAN